MMNLSIWLGKDKVTVQVIGIMVGTKWFDPLLTIKLISVFFFFKPCLGFLTPPRLSTSDPMNIGPYVGCAFAVWISGQYMIG